MNATTHTSHESTVDHAPCRAARVETIDSTQLIGSAKLVHIQHRGEIYSLRQTRLGKLILTK